MNVNRFYTALIALCIGTLSFALPTQAQESTAPPAPTWMKTIGKQLRGGLESSDPQVKRNALQHITYFASFYKGTIDFSETVPTLVKLYRTDDDADVRLFAMVALYTIGDKRGMAQVRRTVQNGNVRFPPRLQLVSMAALANYYGPESFKSDQYSLELAQDLLNYYTSPQVIVGPMRVGPPRNE